jgi:hypothetical protein
MPPTANPRTTVLLRSEVTDTHLSVTDIVVPPHSVGPPLHTHDFDETFYILDRELIFQIGNVVATKTAREAGIHRGLPTEETLPASELTPHPPRAVTGHAANRPISARLEPARRLRSVEHWFLAYTFPSR